MITNQSVPKTTMLHNLDPEDVRSMIKEAMGFNPDKFYNVLINQDEFCKVHSISRTTLWRYIKTGVGVPIDQEEGKEPRFRLSEVLRFDIDSIKYKQNQKLIQDANRKKRTMEPGRI